ncbi:MAG: hypothetical protein GC136_00145 [Alphaproteobacteria bacterium]|nr:hypothetical protein [Alphaproteobacteria bacterium]
MPRTRNVKTNFTHGEVTRQILGRGDLRAYENGALTLRNLFIFPTGGLTRRAGLYFIDTVGSDGRLIPFEFNTEQTYLLVLSDEEIKIYDDGTLMETLEAPWSAAQVKQVSWTQSADTLLLVHPDVPPKKLVRTTSEWELQDWDYFTESNGVYQPYYKFAASGVTIDPSATSGTITLTASSAVFTAEHEGTRLRIAGKEVLITDFDSATVVTATVQQTLTSSAATIDWQEQAFSAARGYPAAVAFHQDRLVIGGSRDLPNRLWFSKSGDLFNFDLGDGTDDEAIEFSILSDQVNAIRAVFSGRHLQVFTGGAEWMVTGEPLTPTNIQLNRQTRVGSPIDRFIPPVDVDGATLFVARNKQEIREFLYADVEQAYQAIDLALLSKHIIEAPVDQDFDQKRRLLFVVREDGKFATLTIYRAEQVSAWTLHETDGNVKSVAVVGDTVYLLVARNGSYTIEEFDDGVSLDSALSGDSETATVTWSGLTHLNGKNVMVLADGKVQGPFMVSAGSVTIDEAAEEVIIGLPYTHIIEPLPLSVITEEGSARTVRMVEAAFRLEETSALRLDTGSGLKDITLRQVGEELLDAPPPIVSGDIRVRALGWQYDLSKPLWRIEQSTPLPFTLLSVNAEVAVGEI